MRKYIFTTLLIFLSLFLVTSAQTLQVLRGPQGGTNVSSTSAGNIGNCLKVSSVNPLVWTIGSCGSGGSFTTTTINGLSVTSYTFATSTGIQIATSAPGTITFTNTAPNFNTTTSVNGLTGVITGLNIYNTTTTLVAGTGIIVSNGGIGNTTVTNNGVLALTAGTGISVSSATGTVTISNTGSGSTTTINGLSSPFNLNGLRGINVSSTVGSTSSTLDITYIPRDRQAVFGHQLNTPSTTPSYLFEDFIHHISRWSNTGSGSYLISNGQLTVTTPAASDVIMTRTLWTAILNGYDRIAFDVNFHGNTLLTAADTPLFSFNQTQDRGILLNNWATNGANGWQHVDAPLSYFTSNFDGTPSSAGTGNHLQASSTVSNFKFRVYENSAGVTTSIKNIVLYDSTAQLKEDFTQPDIFYEPKFGNGLWKIRGLDVMKLSKDNVTSQYSTSSMRSLMLSLQALNPTHYAISVPYDYPAYMKSWSDEVHKAGYGVWHRQTWNAFEGIWGVTKASSTGMGTATSVINGLDRTSYLGQIYNYILTNPNQYAPGDIFAPLPEPDNAGINGITACSDSVCQFATAEQFRIWLRDAITVSNYAFEQIGLKGRIYVGFYGVSGFIAFGDGAGNPKGFLDERTADAMKWITMDDYPNPSSNVTSSFKLYESIYGQFPLVLGEWGTINETTTSTRAAAVDSVVGEYAQKSYVQGMNYWTVAGGSNENLVNGSYSQIGGFDRMRYWYNSGKPFNVATYLGSLDWNPIFIASSTPTAGQVLVAQSSTSTLWSSFVGAGGLTITTSTAGQITFTQGAGNGNFTTTTLNGMSSTTYTFTAGTGLTLATSAPSNITYTNSAPNFNTTTTIGGLTGNIVLRASTTFGLSTSTGFINFSNPEKCDLSFTIENPTSTVGTLDNSPGDIIGIFGSTSTITRVRSVNTRTGDTVGFNLTYNSSRNSATSTFAVFSSQQTSNSTTSVTSVTPTASSTPGKDDILRISFTSASSSQFHVGICYKEQ